MHYNFEKCNGITLQLLKNVINYSNAITCNHYSKALSKSGTANKQKVIQFNSMLKIAQICSWDTFKTLFVLVLNMFVWIGNEAKAIDLEEL